jgi:hypothetical protein
LETQVDVIRQTTPPVVEPTLESQQSALQSLVDREAIRDLVALYAILRDDHQIDALMECFAPDGTFVSGGREITGHEALREWYLGNMRRNTFSHHIPHSCVIQLDSATTASGIVTGTAEFPNPETLIVGSYRWYDDYVKIDGRWVFARRDHKWMFAVPVDELASLGRDAMRIRATGAQPREGEWQPQSV